MHRNLLETVYEGLLSVAALLVLGALILPPSLSYAQSPEAHKATVLAFNDAVNDRAFERLDTLVKADFVRHSPATPGVQVRSRQAFIDYLRSNQVIFPDEHVTMHRLVAEDDHVGFWATYHGTQREPIPMPTGALPATGRAVAMPFSGVFRFEDGQIAELWVTWDNLGMLSQLGHVPPGDASVDVAAARREMLAADQAWAAAAKAGDVERVLTYWADDVVVYLEGRPVAQGHDAMEAVVRRNRALPGFSMARTVTGGEAAASGDFGYTTGTFEMTVPGSDGDPMIRTGHYVCVWEKQADGSWKCIVQASNTRSGSSAASN